MSRRFRLALVGVLVGVGVLLVAEIIALVLLSVVPSCDSKLVTDDVKGFDFSAEQVIPNGIYPNADFSDLQISEAYVSYSDTLSDKAGIVVEKLQGKDVTRVVTANVIYRDSLFEVSVPFTIDYVLGDDGWQPADWRAGTAVVTPRT